jgi:hypothetical protein
MAAQSCAIVDPKVLVRVEAALSVYEEGVFLSRQPLYPSGFRSYPSRDFLGSLIYVVGLAAIAFVAVVRRGEVNRLLWQSCGTRTSGC